MQQKNKEHLTTNSLDMEELQASYNTYEAACVKYGYTVTQIMLLNSG